MAKIHIILTGGTLDSFYDGTKDTAVPNKTSVVPHYIESLKLYEEVSCTEVCMKDSRDLTEDDLKKITQAVEQSAATKIIVIHGTYTMPDTARHLKENLKRSDQTIILTASMIPLIGFSPSDAAFNLEFAMAKVQDTDIGIYVCVNGRVFSPEEVTKDIRAGRFNSVFSEK